MSDLVQGREPGHIRMTPALRRIGVLACWLLGVTVAAADAVAFSESYNGLRLWAAQHRLHGAWAIIWPLQVDAFILAGEIVLLLSAMYAWSQRAKVLGWAMSLIGLAGSIAWNAGHVGTDASGADHITAAVPPIAAMAGLAAILSVIKHVVLTGPSGHPSGALTVPGSSTLGPATVGGLSPWAEVSNRVHGWVLATREVREALVSFEVAAFGTLPEELELTLPAETDTEAFESGPALHLMRSDAERVRHALNAMHGVETTPVEAFEWLSRHGIEISLDNVRQTIKRERAKSRQERPVLALANNPK